jgi:nucleoid DNA-binding protein
LEITDGIQQLLYGHNTVIVPGFGVFKSSYRAAGIHPTQHVFAPPHKAIIFEKKDTDDGLLTHYISEKDDMPPATIVKKISVFVSELNRELDKKGEVTINGIGSFKYDIEKQLHFIQNETVNFLTSSYGLDQFISHSILRRNEQPGTSLSLKKKKKVIATVQENSILLWVLLAFIFACVAAVYFIFSSGIITWWHS